MDKQTGEILAVSEYLPEDENELNDSRIEAEPDRYVEIPQFRSGENFEIREDFVEMLPHSKEKRTLERALAWKKPFSNFKNALNEMGELRQKWFDYEDKRLKEIAKEWLESEGIKIEC